MSVPNICRYDIPLQINYNIHHKIKETQKWREELVKIIRRTVEVCKRRKRRVVHVWGKRIDRSTFQFRRSSFVCFSTSTCSSDSRRNNIQYTLLHFIPSGRLWSLDGEDRLENVRGIDADGHESSWQEYLDKSSRWSYYHMLSSDEL